MKGEPHFYAKTILNPSSIRTQYPPKGALYGAIALRSANLGCVSKGVWFKRADSRVLISYPLE